MFPRWSIRLFCCLLTAGLAAGCGPSGDAEPGEAPADTTTHRHLLIVLDGLRPDYVTPELMPNLHALGARGIVFTNHHAVYPTVTRVNASSISTGAYPETHGLMGNSVFFPAVDPTRFLSTGERENLLRINESEQGDLLLAPTLGETLDRSGVRLLAVSSGSSGSAFLLNHTVAGGGIIHHDYALPPSLEARVREELGGVPEPGTPNAARNRYVVDAFLTIGLREVDPTVTLMWLSDPDTTAHAHGIGHPTSNAALSRIDEEIGRIQGGLADAGLLETVNIWVTSDHGFSTHTGSIDLGALLAPFQGTREDGSPRIVAGSGAIYVRDGDRAVIAEIVSTLQQTEEVGAIFTPAASPGDVEGSVAGTLAFEVARWTHGRSADILFSPSWTAMENEHGYPGTTASGGVAGHGSSSPYDIHNTLIAAGPDLKQGMAISVPTGNVDFAPTLLSLLGLGVPPSMQGRVLREAARDGPDPSSIDVESVVHRAEIESGDYRLTAHSSIVDGRRYLDHTEVERR